MSCECYTSIYQSVGDWLYILLLDIKIYYSIDDKPMTVLLYKCVLY